MKVEDNCRVYEGEDAFLWLPTTFSKSVHYILLGAVICMPDHKPSELGTERGS